MSKPDLLYVGPLLGRRSGRVVTQGYTLSKLFRDAGYTMTGTSESPNRFVRLTEIVSTLIWRAGRDEIVILDVFGGRSFVVEDIASWIAKRSNKHLIMVLRGGEMPDFMNRFPRWSARVLERGDILVAPSSFLRQQLQQYGYDITVIPNTLELDHYTFRHRNQVQPHLFWMRSFHPLYNPEMAVRVLAEVRRILPEATLVMGGGDKGALEPTRQLAQELGVAEAVTFAGYLSLEAKQQHFAAADIYLNTNRADNMPVTVLEAGANGLVVIATEVGGIPYLVENEKSALLVPNDDASAMAEAVVRVVQQSSLAATLSSGGRQLAESCSWTRVLPQWQRLFETF